MLLAVRVLVFLSIAVDVVSERRFQAISQRADATWDPISLLGFLRVGEPSAWQIFLLQLLIVGGVVAALFGEKTRLGGFVVATCYSVLVLAHNSFGKIDHDRNVLVIAVWILSFAPTPSLTRSQGVGREFRWPVQMIRLSLGLMFLSAGWAKVRLGQGFDWVFGPNLRNVLASEVLIYETPDLRTPPLSSLALWIAERQWAWRSAGLGALIGEFSLIFAVLASHRWVRRFAVAWGVGTMCGITLLMGMVSFPILSLAAVFADFECEEGESRTKSLVLVGLFFALIGITMVWQKNSIWPFIPLLAAWLVLSRCDPRGERPAISLPRILKRGEK